MPSKASPTGGKQDCTLSLTLNTPSTPSRLPPTRFPSESSFPQKCDKDLDEVFVLPDATITAQHFCGSAPGHINDVRDLGNSKDNVKFREVNKHVTGEIKAAAGRQCH